MIEDLFAEPFDAIVLAGGRARRLGGIDKSAVEFRGRSLLSNALDSVVGAQHRVVVGHQDAAKMPAGVLCIREDPPWAGPAAALVAGLAVITSRLPSIAPSRMVVVLACDLVFPGTALRQLAISSLPLESQVDGAMATDDDGRPQPLLGIYRTASLTALARHGPHVADRSLRDHFASLTIAEVPVPSLLCADIDTRDDALAHGVVLPGIPLPGTPGDQPKGNHEHRSR